MRLRLVQCQPVHQPLQLAQGDPLGRRLPAGRPLNGAPFQPAIVEPLCRKIGYAEILRSILVKARQPGASGTGTRAISG